MEQIAKQQGIKWTHVPFKGNADAINALLGGHIHAVADSSGWAQLVNAGQFRLLVTWGAARTKNWPNVPTLRDIGIDMVSNSPFGIAGPKGMDREDRQGSARRLQEGDGGAVLRRDDGQARSGTRSI